MLVGDGRAVIIYGDPAKKCASLSRGFAYGPVEAERDMDLHVRWDIVISGLGM